MKGFNTFGVMLDMSRNGVMTVERLKRFIDLISAFGYDSLGLYTEDTFSVEGEPFFGYMRGAYSEKELRELDGYAKSKNVTLFPCVQTLAHLNAIFRWQKYAEIKDLSDILLIGDEKTYALIDNMFKSLRNSYSTDRINIGMDEAHLIGLGRYLDKNGFSDRNEIILSHLKKVSEIAKKYGFNPEMWSDMFFRLANGGLYKDISDEVASRIKPLIPDNVSLVCWNYYDTKKSAYDNSLKNHLKLSGKVKFAGGGWSWTGFAPNNSYAIKTVKASLDSVISHRVKDYYITLWGDDGKECSYFSCLPTLFYASEYAKGNRDIKAIKERFGAVTGASYDDFILLDRLNYLSKADKLSPVNPSKYMLYNDLFLGLYDGTVTPDCEKIYKSLYRKYRSLEKRAGEWGYIFASLSALSKVLSIKYGLGIKTYNAYKDKDRSVLKDLIPEYKRLVTELKKFREKFNLLWNKECKPFGWEVHEIRLSGVIGRTQNCLDTLKSYLSGSIDKIEELEVKRESEYDKNSVYVNSWADCVSPSVVSFLYGKI